MTRLTRRNLMKAAAATGLAGALGSRMAFAADEPLGITLVIPSPLGDVGWGHALAAGLEPIKAAYGDKVKVTILENIAEGPDADRIMNKTVADGNKFLIAGSFGYQNGALQIASRDPSVTVLHASGFQVAPNFSPFAAKYFQGTYLLGMAAAALSKTGKLGSVSAFAIPELITSINAFTLGAQSVNPDIEVSVVWVNSWFDPAKEQEAAKALIAQKCDVIFSNAQDTPSVIAACEEAGVYCVQPQFFDEEICREDLSRLRRNGLVALLQGVGRCPSRRQRSRARTPSSASPKTWSKWSTGTRLSRPTP